VKLKIKSQKMGENLVKESNWTPPNPSFKKKNKASMTINPHRHPKIQIAARGGLPKS
jgi:hypothetical protein